VGLNTFLSEKFKEIIIDDAGWGDLILGVVIGALKFPGPRYMERRIPVNSFQPPNFEMKRYLDDALKIVEEIVEAMRADEETRFKICSGYVLSDAHRYLRDRGFHVEKVEVTGELQKRVEYGYIKWCTEVGVPAEMLSQDSRKRFQILLNWVGEKPEIRESLVKTGWKSWREKWREITFKMARK
jgi:hypothetical protein